MIRYTCDRCKAYVAEDDRLELTPAVDLDGDEVVDLCHRCARDFRLWLSSAPRTLEQEPVANGSRTSALDVEGPRNPTI